MDVAGPVAGAVNVAILSVYACCLSQIQVTLVAVLVLSLLACLEFGEAKCTFLLFISGWLGAVQCTMVKSRALW